MASFTTRLAVADLLVEKDTDDTSSLSKAAMPISLAKVFAVQFDPPEMSWLAKAARAQKAWQHHENRTMLRLRFW